MILDTDKKELKELFEDMEKAGATPKEIMNFTQSTLDIEPTKPEDKQLASKEQQERSKQQRENAELFRAGRKI